MSCIGHFLDRGLPVAAGWRSWEQLKASGISPDGMVFLERSPYGRRGPISNTSGRPGVRLGWGGSSLGTAQLTGGTAGRCCSSAGTMMPSPSSSAWERDGNPPADHHHQTAGGIRPVGQLRLLVDVRSAGAHRLASGNAPGSAPHNSEQLHCNPSWQDLFQFLTYRCLDCRTNQ